MNESQLLEKFESKYKFLYEEMVNGVPLYTCLRDEVLLLLQGGRKAQEAAGKKGRVYIRRLLDGVLKIRKLRNTKTLIFTSAVYRRDHGRNLAVEYLIDRYPDAAVFEWPARNDAFDSAYFDDPQRRRYCPLDTYVVIYKILSKLHQKEIKRKEEQIRNRLQEKFAQAPAPENENEQAAVDLVISQLPISCATTEFSQKIFKKMFRKYKSVEYAIDFWGSGRENIFPVLQGKPKKIELQHGIITSFHPGYIYPDFVRNVRTDFFQRSLLVYGEATKKLLEEKSVFNSNKIEEIGNPRIQIYKKVFTVSNEKRNVVLFTSQGYGKEYYDTIIQYLSAISSYIKNDRNWMNSRIAIKLHPRENAEIINRYQTELPDCDVYDNTAQLYDLLKKSILHITVTSTALFEAAAFDVPTLLIAFRDYNDLSLYGFHVKTLDTINSIPHVMEEINNNYQSYLNYLKENTGKYS